MADAHSAKIRSKNMAAIRSTGNKTTELKTVKILKRLNMTGWRRHQKLPGRPDFVWRKKKIALFVDGCFWHGCPNCYRRPKSNQAYWIEKIKRNKLRDRRVTINLKSEGWHVFRIKECTLKSAQLPSCFKRIQKLLK